MFLTVEQRKKERERVKREKCQESGVNKDSYDVTYNPSANYTKTTINNKTR